MLKEGRWKLGIRIECRNREDNYYLPRPCFPSDPDNIYHGHWSHEGGGLFSTFGIEFMPDLRSQEKAIIASSLLSTDT